MAKEPGKLNIVAIAVVIALGAGVWAGIRFVPGILTERKVEKVLRQAATTMYNQRIQGIDKPGIEKGVRAELKTLGIASPKIELTSDPEWMIARARYEEQLKMPVAVRQVVVEGKVSSKVGSY